MEHDPPTPGSALVPVDPLDATRRQLAAQYELAHALVGARSVADVADLVLGTVCRLLDWRTASLWMAGRDPGTIQAVAIWPDEPALGEWRAATLSLVLRTGEGLPGRAWQRREPVWIADLSNDPSFPRREPAGHAGLRHGFAYPIVARQEVHAVIECFGPDIRDYDRERTDFLAAMAGQLATFLEGTEARRALAASDARKAGVLAGAVDAIVTSDADGRIEEFNPAAERLFQCSREEAVGRLVADLLVPPELRQQHVAGLAAYIETGRPRILGQRIRTTALRAGDTRVPVELTVTEVRLEGQPMFTAFIRDITEQQQAETARDRFLEILSHELRTPVTAIYGGTRVLERLDPASPSARDLLADVGTEADRLHRLVEDLIVLARAERGAIDVTREPVHLTRVVERVLRGEQARADGVELRLRASPGLPPALGEETYVEQILRNLLSNAIKYGRAGGLVEVLVEQAGDECVVRVLDRGQGIDDREALQLFSIGYRSPATSRLASGSGVGLFVARWLVEAIGGRIWAQARAGGGSEFAFSLPILDPDVEISQPLVTLPAEP
ncbi:MAG TPA: ATP-binding protein [Vitreimonas sp.]|nr:ATP-binding protein [Vitreimonas sp.]